MADVELVDRAAIDFSIVVSINWQDRAVKQIAYQALRIEEYRIVGY